MCIFICRHIKLNLDEYHEGDNCDGTAHLVMSIDISYNPLSVINASLHGHDYFLEIIAIPIDLVSILVPPPSCLSR